jgi:hypothetical protein
VPHRWPHREPPQEEGGKSGKAGPAPHDHLLAVVDEHGVLRHDFTADLPNAAWLRDISEYPTREGKLLDLYPLVSRQVGGRDQARSKLGTAGSATPV